ncbi:MAG: hypothetical protein ACLQD8_04950 [Thermoplasmata archaeon]
MAKVGSIVGGVILMIIGLGFTATIIGAIIGIPLLIIGLYLVIKGATYTPPPPQQQVVYVQPQPIYVQQAAAAVPPPEIMLRCKYCNTVYPETAQKCPSCGATF